MEPDAEYYIRINSDSEQLVMGGISVDGKKLDYSFYMSKRDRPQDRGIWEYVDGKEYDRALKFERTPVREGGVPSALWTGKIEVELSEAIFGHYYEQKDVRNTWAGGDVSYVMGISDPDETKGVMSAKGSTFEVEKKQRRRARYVKGGSWSRSRYVTVRHWDDPGRKSFPSHQTGNGSCSEKCTPEIRSNLPCKSFRNQK